MKDLKELRDQIDVIDRQIVDLYQERMEIAAGVAEYKINTGKKVFDKEREDSKLATLTALGKTDFNKHGIRELFEQIMSMSRKRQYQLLTAHGMYEKPDFTEVESLDYHNARIVFQGTEGAYSQLALREYFGEQTDSYHVETWRDAMEAIKNGLLSFKGTDRRFEYKGEKNGITIIDDYAHHPTEIKATLTSVKHYPHRETWCIFQPHTYTRTKAFFHEFAEALSLADHIILVDIFAARETDTLGMSSQLLAEELKKSGADVYYFPSFSEVENFVMNTCIHGDLLITMGAGDVVNIGESILSH